MASVPSGDTHAFLLTDFPNFPKIIDLGTFESAGNSLTAAVGANAVLIGRPYLYGLGAAGEDGVTKVLNILQREFQMAMVLTGRTNIANIDHSVIWS